MTNTEYDLADLAMLGASEQKGDRASDDLVELARDEETEDARFMRLCFGVTGEPAPVAAPAPPTNHKSQLADLERAMKSLAASVEPTPPREQRAERGYGGPGRGFTLSAAQRAEYDAKGRVTLTAEQRDAYLSHKAAQRSLAGVTS